MAEAAWGAWMGAWKADAGQVDVEQDRLSRAQAAFGGETMSRMKDLNVLILGCRGVGVETAKNLILSNVGSVTVWDPTPARTEDLGANFYLSASSVGKPRSSECIAQLKSLNPYCKVEVLQGEESALPGLLGEANVVSSGKGYSAVVITDLLPKKTMVELSAQARSKNCAFIMATNCGATTSFFSDFGAKHLITDEDGEPTQMLAMSNAEIITATGIVKVDGAKDGDKLLVITLASDHQMQDGDSISLDDMRGDLERYNGKQLKVKRVGLLSPTAAKVDVKDVAVKEMLKSSTADVFSNFTKQYEYYKAEFDKTATEGQKFRPREITLFNRLCLVLEEGDAADAWTKYESGGLVNTVKPLVTKEYGTFEKTLVETPNPQMMDQEAWQVGDGCWVQLALAAVLRFQEANGRWPALMNAADAKAISDLALAINQEQKAIEGACWLQKIEWGFPSGEAPEDIAPLVAKIERFSQLFQSELTGFCAFLGGVAAQEVIKKTGKFTPVEQWVHHDDACLVASKLDMGAYAGTRYAHQAAVFGADVMQAVTNQKVFLVGCGALGCEYMKGIALMGACTGPNAKLVVTDMDNIEVSNLSRQFLFRHSDVGSAKSTSAARVVKGWNPDLKVEALEKGVGTTSEDFFDDAFWRSKEICWNALDNVVARKYTDSCCLWYGLPLLESGTLGTKSNSDIFLPSLTKSYNDGVESDANETQIAMCTLRSFPYLPIHCIEFAKQAYFSDYLEFAPQQYETFRKDPSGFFEQLEAMDDGDKFKAMKGIKSFIALQQAGPVTFETLIKYAFNIYCKDFVTSVRDLVYSCDEMEKSSGKPFWTGTKRKPVESPWDSASPPAEGLEYLYATANCYAFIWKVPFVRNRVEFEKRVIALKLAVPEWKPPSENVKVETEDDDGDKVDPEALEALKGELYTVDGSKLQACEAHDFEKDDDNNFHIDFMTAATNARAKNYSIKVSERAHVKVTAGRIIPALATTTAMICGLVDIEFLKLCKGLHKGENPLDQFYNANVNLATGSQAMNLFRPEPVIKRPTKLTKFPEFTSWDKEVIRGEMSVKALVEYLETKYGLTISHLLPPKQDKIVMFDASQKAKLTWKIEVTEDTKVTVEPDAVYGAWPQLKMAVQMLGRVPAGAARNNFLNQVNNSIKSLNNVKENFTKRFEGPVSEAYRAVARPSDQSEEEAKAQKYFDAVWEKRPYVVLQVHATNSEGEDVDFPLIQYNYKGEEGGEN